MPTIENPFARFAYTPYSRGANNITDAQYQSANTPKVVFTGGDLQGFINNKKLTNLESITWSISVEVVGNYVMGRRDAVLYTTGKRVIVGSIVFSQYDRHAIIEEVFALTTGTPPIRTVSDLWNYDSENVGRMLSSNRPEAAVIGTTTISGVRSGATSNVDPAAATSAAEAASLGLRGLSAEAFNDQLRTQLRETARLTGAQKLDYVDQLPPFDLTLVGVTQQGEAARCAIFGMKITQETTGFSQNDLSNSVGMSFVALAVSPWRPVQLSGATAYIPPTA
jgi:hypothetical protein